MEGGVSFEGPRDLNLKATELRLGLPGTDHEDECDHHHQTQKPALNVRMNNKRPLVESDELAFSKKNSSGSEVIHGDPETETAPAPSKQHVVGWPPIRSYRKNSFQPKKNESSSESSGGIYVKVSMDGAPYLRKIDLKMYKGYPDLLKALENMFKFSIGQYSEREGYNGSEYAPTYEDKDGDWMLVGDVPWEMFISSCKKLRIMKGSEARGLGCGV